MLEELPLDANWDDIYSFGTSASVGTGTYYRDEELPVYQCETTQILQGYLMWKVELTLFSYAGKAIATLIVEAVDNTGYLTVALDDILGSIGDDNVSLDTVEAMLKCIQRFDPIGVAARDLRDYLLIQLYQFSANFPYRKGMIRLIVSDYLELLGSHDFRVPLRLSKLKEDALKKVMTRLQFLDPRLGPSINTGESQYVIPDVLACKVQNRRAVKLNTDSIPVHRISQQYAALGNSTHNNSDDQFICIHQQDACWLIKSQKRRNEESLLKVTRCIVDQQLAFLEQGEEFIRTMVRVDIAQMVDMHEYTISRVTTQKYLYSTRCISHFNTEVGGGVSSTAIRVLVKKLIAAESPANPLSNSKLTNPLSAQSIMVARRTRTVAKYRESLSMSNQRKQLV